MESDEPELSYLSKCSRNFDQGKRNLVRVSEECKGSDFELTEKRNVCKVRWNPREMGELIVLKFSQREVRDIRAKFELSGFFCTLKRFDS